ncbi:MAG: hypothetical protein ACLPTZ_17840 [Beijerinckiaceae bacterium]
MRIEEFRLIDKDTAEGSGPKVRKSSSAAPRGFGGKCFSRSTRNGGAIASSATAPGGAIPALQVPILASMAG